MVTKDWCCRPLCWLCQTGCVLCRCDFCAVPCDLHNLRRKSHSAGQDTLNVQPDTFLDSLQLAGQSNVVLSLGDIAGAPKYANGSSREPWTTFAENAIAAADAAPPANVHLFQVCALCGCHCLKHARPA